MLRSPDAICQACAAPKELPLARCGSCGFHPTGEAQEIALLCSTRLLTPEQLADVADRLARGEPLNPSPQLRARARALLHGKAEEVERQLTGRELVALTVGNVLLTPLLGYAVWFRLRERPGIAARQALFVTLPVSVVLAAAWILLVRW